MKLYDATQFPQGLLGGERVCVLYENWFIGGAGGQLAAPAGIDAAVARAISTGLKRWIINIEHWPLRYQTALDRAQWDDSIQTYTRIFQRVKSNAPPDVRVGFFQPGNVYDAVDRLAMHAEYAGYYRAMIGKMAGALSLLDDLYPAHYVCSDLIEPLIDAMAITRYELRLLGKPTIPVLWHGVSGGAVPQAQREVPVLTIRRLLEHIEQQENAVCWWSHSSQSLDVRAAWFRELKRFVR